MSAGNYTYKWLAMYENLKAYHAEHGDCIVPTNYKNKPGPSLGRWVSNQRQLKERLSHEQIELLQEIDFAWSVLAYDHWSDMYQKLKEYQQEYGDCLVSTTFLKKGYNPNHLGRWVSRQRAAKASMRKDRRALLDDIGFVWNVAVPHDKNHWKNMFDLVVAYKEKHGHCVVPAIYKGEGNKTSLGRWVGRQRERRHKLSDEQRTMLEDIGFVWNAAHGNSNTVKKMVATPNKKKDVSDEKFDWQSMHESLKRYYQEHGDCLVPVYHRPLSTWVSQQRKNAEYLSDEQRQLLNAIGFSWDGGHSMKLFYLAFPPGNLGIGLGHQSESKRVVIVIQIPV